MEETNLTSIKGIGPSTAKSFALIGINSITELLGYYPRKYSDYSDITPIKSIKPGVVTIKAKIAQANGRYVRRGMHITEAIASDDTGSMRLVWFNQPYRADAIKSGEEYFITGKLELKMQRFQIMNPATELVSSMPVHTARIVPIYRESRGVTARIIRKAMAEALKLANKQPEVVPDWLRQKHKLLNYEEAIKEIHFPTSLRSLDQARRTFGFIEIFELMLASSILKAENSNEKAPKIKFDEKLAKKFVSSLSYKLTDAQRAAAWQALKDLEKSHPANRLIEGDVGSGKTVVAALTAVMAMNSGHQVALLAPTELLARQHAQSVAELLMPVGMDSKLGLLVGSLKQKQKAELHQRIQTGDVQFVIGTHALLQDSVAIHNLGLILVDEQHRFGVEQRQKLLRHNKLVPHIISLTATPIPRSLALTLYGELDISLLDAMPPGRKKIITRIISPNSRDKMEQHIEAEIIAGRQVYVVCPVISEGKLDTTSVESTFERLSKKIFKNFSVELLHGKLKTDEKQLIMQRFYDKRVNILVSTTVIEVGVNVPNASIMVIEGADRFGLAQLHQLRGRVGRSSQQSYCYVVPSDSKAPSKRLRAFEQSNDGFRLAELDLEIRGPGAIYGTLQHGELDLRFANLTDTKLLAEARSAVKEFRTQDNIDKYPELARRVRQAQAVITLN